MRRPRTDNERHNGPGCAISLEVVMPTVQKAPSLGTGKRFGPKENSYWARALPGAPSLLFIFCYIIIHVRKKPALVLNSRRGLEAQSGGSYECAQAAVTAGQRLSVKFFWMSAPQEMHYCMNKQTVPLCGRLWRPFEPWTEPAGPLLRLAWNQKQNVQQRKHLKCSWTWDNKINTHILNLKKLKSPDRKKNGSKSPTFKSISMKS